MVYITGDIHGRPIDTIERASKLELAKSDTLILLGDVGANYYGGRRDEEFKTALSSISATIFCIHGNHEQRPHTIATYREKVWNGGTVWYEDDYPNLLFAKDGEVYEIEGNNYLVIGGAYSVDKRYRLMCGFAWWPDEQPSDEIKTCVESAIARNKIDYVLSHTCPSKYTPTECFLPNINQSTVDNTTEQWLDTIEEKIEYRRWYCGHWHINKKIDRMTFLYDDWELVDREKYNEE